MTRFGQVVIGPPGSGKSTYCKAMKEFLKALNRSCFIVNLDAANENLPYDTDVCITELITLEDVMQYKQLGPNGGLMFCMEYLVDNIDWLRAKLNNLTPSNAKEPVYILFDFPGQIELYTHSICVKSVLKSLQKWDYRLVSVQLTDSHYSTDPSKFVSVLLATLSSMVNLEMPHISVLSKADLLEAYAPAHFNLEYFLEVQDLNYLLDLMPDDAFAAKFKNLTKAIVGVIEDYSLVSFQLLDIQNKTSMWSVLQEADNACGYFFSGVSSDPSDKKSLLNCVASKNSLKDDWISRASELYTHNVCQESKSPE